MRTLCGRTAYQRWQTFFANYDVILSPAITISPRPWTELYPKEIDGDPTASYFHWLALAYAVTVVGHPALSLPVGVALRLNVRLRRFEIITEVKNETHSSWSLKLAA